MVRWQEKPRLEQFDERPRIVDLRVGDRVHLIGDDGDINRAELLGERPHARRDRSCAADEHGLETRREDQPIGERALGDYLGIERAKRPQVAEEGLLLLRIGRRIVIIEAGVNIDEARLYGRMLRERDLDRCIARISWFRRPSR